MPGKQVIMVVDDDENIAQLVRLYLEKEGFEVVSFSRGDSALTAFKSNPPALLLLDIMLPGAGGVPAAARLSSMDMRFFLLSVISAPTSSE